jgi:hypothetical protein
MSAAKLEGMRRLLMKERHPVEKLKRIGLGPLSVEGVPRGRYRMLSSKEVEDFRHIKKTPRKPAPKEKAGVPGARLHDRPAH